ncbi:lipopolysaccharide biosynthesis protein [Georgenia subflava]|nr:lipopolysaccharide biosynthesis protein [Georgenia subflava]
MAVTTGLSLYLAVLLGPEPFGVIAMALVFTGFIEMIQQQGLMPAIISRVELRREHADTAFWLVVGVGLAMTVIGIAVAPVWAVLNDLPQLGRVIQVLALGVPLTSTAIVHEALLRRELDFKSLALRGWISVAIGGVAGVVAAFLGLGVWALVAQQLAMTLSGTIAIWLVSSWRPHWRFSKQAASELWSYATRSASGSIGLFLGSRLDVILSGLFFGPVLVGLYRMGQRLATLTVDVTARSIQQVSLPGLSELRVDEEQFGTRLRSLQRLASSLTLPALGVLAGCAAGVERVLGSGWTGLALTIQLIAAAQATRSVTLLIGPALQSIGRPGTLSITVWVWTGLTAAALVGASFAGDGSLIGDLVALCGAIAFSTLAGSVFTLLVAFRVLPVRCIPFLSSCLPGAVGGVIGGSAAAGVLTISLDWPPLPHLALSGLAGIAVAAGAVFLMDARLRAIVVGRLRGLDKLHHKRDAFRAGSRTARL